MHAEQRWPAMGTWAHLVVHGDDAPTLLVRAQQRVEELEALWSRFRPSSEVSRANARRGEQVPASPETVRLVKLSAAAAAELSPHFNPCLLDDVVAWGYDRSFALLGSVTAAPTDRTRERSSPGLVADGLVAGEDWIQVPASGFDPGSIGKGLAADLVAEELFAAGAAGVLVNLGGDLRCLGTPPPELGNAWSVEVTDEDDASRLVLRLGAGGVATSSSRRRRWHTVAGPAHHLLDPRTGGPVPDALRSVTVLSNCGWRSEVVATAVLAAGMARGTAIVERTGSAAFIIDADGTEHTLGDLDRFVATAGDGR